MEITNCEIFKYFLIEVRAGGNIQNYRRDYFNNSWEILMGESWENVEDTEELEKVFLDWFNKNSAKGLNTDFLNVL